MNKEFNPCCLRNIGVAEIFIKAVSKQQGIKIEHISGGVLVKIKICTSNASKNRIKKKNINALT
jgi:hypothetical protein